MADVFVSYASEDRQRVEPLVHIIEASGLTVWWDRHLLSGAEWDHVIQSELAKASKVVVVWTKNSVDSNWVRTEAMEGLERNILYPVLLDRVKIPLAFKRIHATDLTSTLEIAQNPQTHNLLSALTNSEVAAPAVSPNQERSHAITVVCVCAAFIAFAGWIWLSIGHSEPDGARRPTQVAVMPIRNLTPSQELDWLSDGLAELLRGQINAWHDFIALPGAMTYTRSINELPDTTEYALDGSIQLEGEQVTVRLDAIDVRSADLLWSQTISTSLGDPFELQRRISARVAREFGERLTDVVPPPAPDAYRYFLPYLSIRTYGNPSEHRALLHQILDEDPNWVYGWADLAWVLMRASSLDFRTDLLSEGSAALEHAMRLSPQDASDWGWVAAIDKMFFHIDLVQGEQEAALAATQGYPILYLMMMLTAGLFADAEAAIEKQTELSPFDAVGWELLSAVRANLEDPRGAHQSALAASRLYPQTALLAQSWPVLYPDYPAAVERSEIFIKRGLEQLREMNHADLHYVGTHRWVAMVEFKLAMYLEDEARATAAAERAGANGAIDAAAMMYLRLNDPRADEYFRIATQGPSFNRFNHYHLLPLLTPELRVNPLVRTYENAMGFTPEWRRTLCQKATELPPETGITCNPARYAVKAH